MANQDKPTARDLRAFADQILEQQGERLREEFGTAQEGRAFHTMTHSRFDVLQAARALAQAAPIAELVDSELVPLIDLAVIFHAAGGSCGDGAKRAEGELKQPDSPLDAVDWELVTTAIAEAAAPRGMLAGMPPVARRRGIGLEGAAVVALGRTDLAAAILADADRAHLGLPYGPHRIVLRIIEQHRTELPVPELATGAGVKRGRAILLAGLVAAVHECERVRFTLAEAERLFPLREENAKRLRAFAKRVRCGTLSWPELLQETAANASRT